MPFRSLELKGNVAKWTDTHWDVMNTVKTVAIDLSFMCSPIRIGAVIFPEKHTLMDFSILCQTFSSQMFLIKDEDSVQEALALKEHPKCGILY